MFHCSLRFPTLRLPVSPTGRGRLRSHQAKCELVATLDAASDKEAVFLYIVWFLKAGMNLFVKVRSRFFFILLFAV